MPPKPPSQPELRPISPLQTLARREEMPVSPAQVDLPNRNPPREQGTDDAPTA